MSDVIYIALVVVGGLVLLAAARRSNARLQRRLHTEAMILKFVNSKADFD